MATTRVLFVCLGNICRSPAAEGVFLHQINQRTVADRFVVDSAGTGGWHVGRRADARMRASAERRGIALESRARQIDLADIHSFDHILTMDGDNLAAVQALAREAGNPAAQARIEAITRYCRSHRDSREVPDPYYGGEAGFEHVLDLLDDACGGLLEGLLRNA
ncbi:MAG: low molecular weight phosphotyrosine protein phosphatase [Cyanobacteria bacterium K_DeepCast_35m_m2_023]|nr:low molecular weight phosphotyrosine protein phosphatase [Cyanobacteria bacterium K_DeepCast_35m_m2_023]